MLLKDHPNSRRQLKADYHIIEHKFEKFCSQKIHLNKYKHKYEV